MAAIQIGHDKSTENLPDLEHRYDIAERYAQGGILLLRASIAEAMQYGMELAGDIVSMLPAPEGNGDA